MSISISTKDFAKGKKFLIDGMEWEYHTPGAGLTLDLSRASRKSASIQKRIEAGTATEADTEEQSKLVELVIEFYNSVLKDGTKDNKQVRKWLNDNSMETIAAVVQSIQEQNEREANS